MQPVHEGASLLCKSEDVQRIERKAGIPQPRIAVVPVASPSQELWQRRRWSRDDGSGGCVGQQLEREGAAPDLFNIGTVVGALLQPGTPAVQGMPQFRLEVAPRQHVCYQPPSRPSAVCYSQDKQQALPLAQRHLRDEGGV